MILRPVAYKATALPLSYSGEASGWNRATDIVFTRDVLYQLSYASKSSFLQNEETVSPGQPAKPGIEPGLADPESAVPPLHYSAFSKFVPNPLMTSDSFEAFTGAPPT